MPRLSAFISVPALFVLTAAGTAEQDLVITNALTPAR